MSKISKVVVVFIVFLIILVLMMQSQGAKVAALSIQFENETTEPEVKAILENYNIPVNYTIDYNSNISRGKYYIKADEDKINELRKDENWTSVVELKKGNYNIIMLSAEFVPDENFLTILEKNNLQLKKAVVCYVHFGDGSPEWVVGKNCVLEKDAIRIKNELETNEKVLTVGLDYIEG
ncbi:hypothetical protein MSSIT_2959 [Methanosarcina siciliae T4/M]|uniref:Uncharacterized protein n=1 Tax=Methanosarcina siciliae T4/M TaxID=1434120 RepID=A0A0E3P988_9EURY|nr:UPF0228 family protein [Methanosarcina siciliae]AKB29678.1 hypothetical protein MSSIT_2959 [Methanosarcina siciliae T4/M]